MFLKFNGIITGMVFTGLIASSASTHAQSKPSVNIDSILVNNKQVHITQLTSVSQIDPVYTVICAGNVHNYIVNDAKSNSNFSGDFEYDTVDYSMQLCKKSSGKWTVIDSVTLISGGNYIPDGVAIKIEDIDLDGNINILLLLACDGRGNHKYRLYTVNTLDGKLIEIKGFEKLSDPQYDEKRKVFYSTEKFSGGETRSTYKIINNTAGMIK